MKKIFVTFLMATIAFVLIGCQEASPELSFAKLSYEMKVGEELTLKPEVKNSEEDVKINYDVADSSIVSIENNVLKALSAGETTIVVNLADYADVPAITLSVVVTLPLPTAITIKGDNVVVIGEEITLTAEFTPANAESVELEWSSDNTAVATVEDGKVTGITEGEANITAKFGEISSVIKVSVVKPEAETVVINGETSMEIGNTQKLTVVVTPANADGSVTWSSDSESVATVDQDGNVTAVGAGSVTITATSVATPTLKNTFEITVNPIAVVSVTINGDKNKLAYNEEVELTATVLPAEANQTVVWSSNDETIATVVDGKVKAISRGTATIVATAFNNVEGQFVVTVNDDLDAILEYFETINEKEVIAQTVRAIGYQAPGFWDSDVYGSVSKYRFVDNVITEMMTPINDENRPGTKKTSVEFITVHDTASMAASGTALAHASYVNNGGGGTSWSYSVGNDGIYHQIPDDEVSYHAGDGTSVPFTLTDTGVPATTLGKDAVVTIADGYYFINDVKTSIKIPKVSYYRDSEGLFYWTSDGATSGRMYYWNDKTQKSENPSSVALALSIIKQYPLTTELINDSGLHVVVGENGNYYMGKTYFNGTYKYISNRGGNLNSIGMETMVNLGSDLYLTWHRAAKLSASLCIQNSLDTSRVKPHHFFSGKNCPQTMRDNALWENFLTLVEAEYNVAKNILGEGYTVTFVSNNPEIVDAGGRIIAAPLTEMTVTYTITVSKDGNSRSRTYSSHITPIAK